ncbi:hypothetical protein PPTG_20970 [Phytophthora nicotianae INRA-310]|uniref:Uncharacterized protein n=1 Tax=Phytophthora nicotianae (strain INRA-310) TaxID=761204 RepID=W2REA8_PHYN3|nr:hypothetical protein PPTG_20970 [Phytophthora nicotianae INRA-310]ETN23024.1 hypothetical protein PPTG_20970 [Phytophthora nicotianae INRA-310]
MVELSQSMDMSLKHNITNATLILNGNSAIRLLPKSRS